MDVVRLTGGEHFLQQDLLDITHAVQAVLKPIETFFYRSSK
jgi:molybdenum cofactor biosynthesis enzyme MoaA